MITCALPDFNSDDFVSFQNPAKFWVLFSIYVIAALLLLCSLVTELTSLVPVQGLKTESAWKAEFLENMMSFVISMNFILEIV